MDKEKVFSEVLEKKEAFLDYKNIGSKNPPNLPFFKGVSPWCLAKNEWKTKPTNEKESFSHSSLLSGALHVYSEYSQNQPVHENHE